MEKQTKNVKQKGSVFVRTSSSVISEFKRPRPLKNYDVQMAEDGSSKLVECPVVKRGLASEFDVASNAMVNRPSRSRYRANVDPADVEQFLSDNNL